MSSINPHVTFEYSQPDEYRFSHDSVFLARQAFELLIKENINPTHVLDICSGSGIVGLDFLFHQLKALRPEPDSVDFVEIQNNYLDHFKRNASELKALTGFSGPLNFLEINYALLQNKIELKNKYDLVLCNPPYFRIDQGKLSPSNFKNRCRFFIDSTFDQLLFSIAFVLRHQGHAFILLKDLAAHGISLEKELRKFEIFFAIKKQNPIRGTGFYQLIKK